MVEEEKKGIRRVNCPRWEGGDKRYIGKLLKKKNWFKKKGKRQMRKGGTVERELKEI